MCKVTEVRKHPVLGTSKWLVVARAQRAREGMTLERSFEGIGSLWKDFHGMSWSDLCFRKSMVEVEWRMVNRSFSDLGGHGGKSQGQENFSISAGVLVNWLSGGGKRL